jgi:hypothetical protein
MQILCPYQESAIQRKIEDSGGFRFQVSGVWKRKDSEYQILKA